MTNTTLDEILEEYDKILEADGRVYPTDTIRLIQKAFEKGKRVGQFTKCKCMAGDTARLRCICWTAGYEAGREKATSCYYCKNNLAKSNTEQEDRIASLEKQLEEYKFCQDWPKMIIDRNAKITALEAEIIELRRLSDVGIDTIHQLETEQEKDGKQISGLLVQAEQLKALMKDVGGGVVEKFSRMEAENARLRDALKEALDTLDCINDYGLPDCGCDNCSVKKRAKKALEGK